MHVRSLNQILQGSQFGDTALKSQQLLFRAMFQSGQTSGNAPIKERAEELADLTIVEDSPLLSESIRRQVCFD